MGWATTYIEELKAGRAVRFSPSGHSMTGRVNHGDLVEVAPLSREPEKGDVVLCRVRGNQYLHLVSAVRKGQVQISNNRGHVNGWTGREQVYGVLTAVNPPGPVVGRDVAS